MKNKCISPRI